MRPSWPGRWAAICAAMIVVATGAARSAPAPVSGVFEYEIEMAAGGKPAQKMTQKVWAKGAYYRSETATPNGKQIMINGPDGALILSPGSNEAMKMRMPPGAKSSLNGSPFGDMAKIKQMKKVGTEKVGAYTAEIHEQTSAINRPNMPSGQISNRFWITDRLPVPVKIMNKNPMMQVTMVLKTAQPNAAVPDSMFQLPKGTKIREMTGPPGRPLAPKGK